MLKRFFLTLAISAGLLSPVYSAGTIPFSLSQQLDQFAKPLANCFFYTIQAGTTSTPQNAYQDSALTIPLSNPQRCDAAGRLPQMFLADGSVKVRLTTSLGVNVITADNIQVIGNSSGGGGGSPVDPTTIIATGDMKLRYGTGPLSGFVRANGRTIGSATSGATERANVDAQVLFEYLWNTDGSLAVSSGRGASSAADWAANKTIALPDWRGRVPVGMDDMGNTAAGILTTTFYNNSPLVLGNPGGQQAVTLTAAQLPSITSVNPGVLSLSVTSTNWIASNPSDATAVSATAGGSSLGVASAGGSVSHVGSTGSIGIGGASVTSQNTGGQSHATVMPARTLTIYLKL